MLLDRLQIHAKIIAPTAIPKAVLIPEIPKENHSISSYFIFKSTILTLLALLGSPMLVDPHPSQLHEGPQHAVLRLQHEVTRPKVWVVVVVKGSAYRLPSI